MLISLLGHFKKQLFCKYRGDPWQSDSAIVPRHSDYSNANTPT